MSKLYEKYLNLKKSNPNKIYIFKNGIFYIFIDEDAKKISPILNLKLSNLNENILKCGFPVNSFQKYINLLKNTNLDFHIVENLSTGTTSIQSNIADNTISNNLNSVNGINNNTLNYGFIKQDFRSFLNKIADINLDTLSIREVYSFLENISTEAKKFLEQT